MSVTVSDIWLIVKSRRNPVVSPTSLRKNRVQRKAIFRSGNRWFVVVAKAGHARLQRASRMIDKIDGDVRVATLVWFVQAPLTVEGRQQHAESDKENNEFPNPFR